MGLFSRKKFNSTFYQQAQEEKIPQEVLNGLVARTFEVFKAHNYIIDESKTDKSSNMVTYQFIEGGELTLIMMNPDRLDICVKGSITADEFQTITQEIEEYIYSLGLAPKRDYYGLTHHYGALD